MERYRAFDGPQEVRLAPLNIVIGRNGGGKSVITRLPMLISGGVDSYRDAPLALETDGLVHANRFEDLIYQRSAQPFALGATVSHDDVEYTVRVKLRHIVENYTLVVEEFSATSGDNLILKATIDEPDQLLALSPRYNVSQGDSGESLTTTISFAGIFPFLFDNKKVDKSNLDKVRMLFRDTFESPAYLGPFRREASAISRMPRQDIASLGPRGEWTLDFMTNDLLRGGGHLARSVEQWFRDRMSGNAVIVRREGDFSRVFVEDPARDLDVDLSETGAGFGQLFPIVVQAMALRSRTLSSRIAIIEQPELHLHPVAHGDVADLLIDTILGVESLCYLVETHSEQFITRVRRRIAEGKIDSKQVQIISVGHKSPESEAIEPLRTITLDSSGTPSSWPLGVFEEAFEDLLQIRQTLSKSHK